MNGLSLFGEKEINGAEDDPLGEIAVESRDGEPLSKMVTRNEGGDDLPDLQGHSTTGRLVLLNNLGSDEHAAVRDM